MMMRKFFLICLLRSDDYDDGSKKEGKIDEKNSSFKLRFIDIEDFQLQKLD